MSIQVNRSPCYCTEIQGFSPLGTSNDKAGYTVTFWFDSINVCCSQKGRKKKEGKNKKTNQNTEIGCMSTSIVSTYVWRHSHLSSMKRACIFIIQI